jgi:UDP-2-acetamido-2,6-beta-L-arabino-hexul-4-ose reductase
MSALLRLGITGGAGFLGWHIRTHVHADKGVQAIASGRELFKNPEAVAAFVCDKNAIVHLAGMNRGDEAEIERTNLTLTRALIDACERERVRPHIVFVNSTHYDRDTAYGRSKRRSAEMLAAWASGSGARFTNLVSPGIFGEGGRPFYNSVVSTFCHQLANDEKPSIHEDSDVELVHAQQVAARILSCVCNGETGEVRIPGQVTSVSALHDRLAGIAEQYRAHVLPSLSVPFDLALFNTYRSYLFPKHYPVALDRRADARGSLFEVVKTVHGGQCFFSTTLPGVTRGNHYHTAKVERFLVAQGEAIIRLRRLFSDEVIEFRVNGEDPVYIDMPTFHTHDITNVGPGELLTLFWAHEVFDPDRPDTFPEPIEP